MRAQGIVVVVFVAAVAGGLALWITVEPGLNVRTPSAASTSTSTSTPTSTSTSSSPSPSPSLGDGGRRLVDDPAFRARIEVHAKIVLPTWGLLAPRIDDAALRGEAEAMVDRLSRLDEPAEALAREEYDLTQRLITRGGWTRSELRWIQEINSGAATVIQGG